jgi:hypothetical protein
VINVGNNQVGVIVATDGEPISSGRLLGKRVAGHKTIFKTGKLSLKVVGKKVRRLIFYCQVRIEFNTKLFQVSVKEATTIPVKEVGFATAKDGDPLPQTEYIAKSIQGHNDFQDSAAHFWRMVVNVARELDFLKPRYILH